MECHVKVAPSCVGASVMLDLSSGHGQDQKAALRKSISVNGLFLVPENHLRHENLFFFFYFCLYNCQIVFNEGLFRSSTHFIHCSLNYGWEVLYGLCNDSIISL